MNIQIFGKKKCFETQKAERYFKERRIKFQAIDVSKYGMSKGEFDNIKRVVGLDVLLDKNNALYYQKNLDKIRGAEMIQDIVLDNPKLFRTPIVRNGKQATVGYQPDIWATWE
ncbi:MAG: ArsC family transcriptional regulator [Clostridia bacterium]|nr:ArsC family transcriptional regulator [Clostridia bacterium]